MQTKAVRFQKWRGSKAVTEQHYLSTALAIASYVDSLETLDCIKTDFHGAKSEKFIAFDQYKGRILGSVLFAKLVVDEAGECVPDEARNTPFFALLTQLNEILMRTYTQERRSTKEDADLIFSLMKQLIALDAAVLTDPQQEKKLLFSLYTLLQFIEPTLASLNPLALFAVDRIIDLDKVKEEARDLQIKIENKVKLFEQKRKSSPEDGLKLSAFQQLEVSLQQRYLKILNSSQPKKEKKSINTLDVIKKITMLQKDMHDLSVSVPRLITLRKNNKELELKTQVINSLFQAAKTNDRQVLGRKYFLDLIRENQKSFTVLMNHVSGADKDRLLTKMSELTSAVEAQTLPIKLLYGLSWLTTPVTSLYRALTPQAVQDGFVTRVSLTLDSECKLLVKQLAERCLLDLNKDLVTQEQQMQEMTTHLFADDEVLKQLMMTVPLEELTVLQKGTEVAKNSLQAYSALLISVKANMDFLHQYRFNSQILNEFIGVNNDFWVSLSNFFAQICALFKTDTAKMIDKATECKRKVDDLCTQYQKAIAQEMQRMEADPAVPKEIKNQLKEHFIVEVNEANTQKTSHFSIKKREVRLLMRSLSQLFASEPKIRIQEMDEDKPNNDEDELKIKSI